MAATGFIGTGTIGAPMAMRLVEAGHDLTVFDLDAEATRALEDKGARRAASVAALAADCTTIFLSLPGPRHIEQVMLGADGVLAHARAGTIVVDLSTNAIALNRRIAEAARARDMQYLDAPVSGGRAGAMAGKLAVMVGGDREAFEAVREFIACFGENIFHLGEAGAGTLTKLINNQIFLAASVLVQEGFVMGAKAGMDPATLLEVLKVSSAGSVVGRAGLFLSRKFDAGLFALAIAGKDIDVALASAEDLGVEMPMTAAASGVYHDALTQGFGGEDFYATLKVLEGRAGVSVPVLGKPQPST
ncbi:MAG: NAD(P)-dependent oxidoreductase [Proteobacteria bacterium]|nr:NAD(P)-dependent oxidoreductase [Pseudomonadota bacterium]